MKLLRKPQIQYKLTKVEEFIEKFRKKTRKPRQNLEIEK